MLVVSDKDYKKTNKMLKGIIHIHFLLKYGLKMIERKKKLRIIQFILLFVGILIIYLTYYNKDLNINETRNISRQQKKN